MSSDTPQPEPQVRGNQDDPLVALFISTGFTDKVRYDHLRSQWYFWNGVRWKPDKKRFVYDLVRQHVNRLFAAKGADEKFVKMLAPLWNWAKKESFLKSLSARSEVAMDGTEWDTQPNLLGFDNGIMDLATGKFDPNPDPTTYVSRTVGCDWDPNAPYDEFESFLESIFPNSPSVINYVYHMLGYFMWGSQREQKFWMWTGRGSNGKGILARTLTSVMGDYAETPSNMLYMKSKFGSAPSSAARPDLVRLQGTRFTPMSEPPGGHFDEELLKAHTGEDTILARDLYGKAASMAQFSPTHKIVFLTNEPPSTDDTGISMRRRARMVRFEEDFTGDRADMTIEDRVRAQKQGILVALVAMAVAWYQNGLPDCAEVDEWSEEYINNNDPLAAWISDDCELSHQYTTSTTVLYGDYQQWCARKGIDPISQTAFGRDIGKRFKKRRHRNGVVADGISLKSIEQRVDDEDEDE